MPDAAATADPAANAAANVDALLSDVSDADLGQLVEALADSSGIALGEFCDAFGDMEMGLQLVLGLARLAAVQQLQNRTAAGRVKSRFASGMSKAAFLALASEAKASLARK